MARRYIDSDEVKITKSDEMFKVDVEWFGGEKKTGLEAKRLFPMSGSSRYISLLDA